MKTGRLRSLAVVGSDAGGWYVAQGSKTIAGPFQAEKSARDLAAHLEYHEADEDDAAYMIREEAR